MRTVRRAGARASCHSRAHRRARASRHRSPCRRSLAQLRGGLLHRRRRGMQRNARSSRGAARARRRCARTCFACRAPCAPALRRARPCRRLRRACSHRAHRATLRLLLAPRGAAPGRGPGCLRPSPAARPRRGRRPRSCGAQARARLRGARRARGPSEAPPAWACRRHAGFHRACGLRSRARWRRRRRRAQARARRPRDPCVRAPRSQTRRTASPCPRRCPWRPRAMRLARSCRREQTARVGERDDPRGAAARRVAAPASWRSRRPASARFDARGSRCAAPWSRCDRGGPCPSCSSR